MSVLVQNKFETIMFKISIMPSISFYHKLYSMIFNQESYTGQCNSRHEKKKTKQKDGTITSGMLLIVGHCSIKKMAESKTTTIT